MSEYRKQISSTEELGQWYSDKYREMGDGWNTPVEECNRHLDDLGVPVNHALRLLDVGCGAGHFLAEATKRVSCSGCEISEYGAELARQRAAATITCISIEDWSYWKTAAKYDYIVSLGSLEHIVSLGIALKNIRDLLKPSGKFYFYCPNELWKHFDQPNERTMTDREWINTFEECGLFVESTKRWNDNTAFIGTNTPHKNYQNTMITQLPPRGTKLNIGSGQRRFDIAQGWVNVDCVSRPPDQVPDLICDVGKEKLPYDDNTMDVVVLHQVYEHFGLGEGHSIVQESHRVLRPGGSLILTLPDMRALAQRWLLGQISDYIYFVNVYGAYQGLEGDRHKFGYTYEGLKADFQDIPATWSDFRRFNWRPIPGADIARDFWILGVEAVK